MGAPHQHGVVDIAINFPLPAARRSLILSRGYQLGAALVDWRTRRPIPTGSLAELYELPLQAIDWWVALEVPPDLVPGSYVEPMQPAPGSSLGYVTLSVRVEVGWRPAHEPLETSQLALDLLGDGARRFGVHHVVACAPSPVGVLPLAEVQVQSDC